MALFLFSGCKVEAPKPPLVETVAILPFDSDANNISAPDIMQKLVYAAMKPSIYRVTDIAETNEKLAKVGIIDGGQLPIIDPVKLGKDMGVQALLYGNVTGFDYTNVGFYIQRKVTIELKLVDVRDGQTLWENTGSTAFRNLTLDQKEAQDQFTKGLADQLIDKLFNTPLEEEAKSATVKALSTLPGYTFTGFDLPEKSGAKVIKTLLKQGVNKQ